MSSMGVLARRAVDLTAIATGGVALLAAVALGARPAGRTAPRAATTMAEAGVGGG